MKKTALIVLLLSLPALLFAGCGKNKAVTLLDAAGEPIADYNGTLELYRAEYSAYAKAALLEAAAAYAAENGISDVQALEKMLAKRCTVYTAAVPAQIVAAAETAADTFGETGVPFAAAATDLSGRLTMIYATAGQVEKTYAGSAIKPLSVYGPCVESGIMTWSAVQDDSPVKQIVSGGAAADWPANGSGTYSHKPVPAAEALAQSLNTVAVRWLTEYGPAQALAFMSDRLGMNVEREQSILALSSAEEILGNVALGYLQAGVDVCEMAGWYQIFANGGAFTPAYTVERITDGAGKTLYTAAPQEKQVLSPETAYILNRMLRGVVDHGTGVKARLDGVDLVGKTGTSENHADNWFVGVTPAGVTAVWHGTGAGGTSNRAAEAFAVLAPQTGMVTEETFAPCAGVEQKIYCPESGLLAGPGCADIAVGYYKTGTAPGVCNAH